MPDHVIRALRSITVNANANAEEAFTADVPTEERVATTKRVFKDAIAEIDALDIPAIEALTDATVEERLDALEEPEPEPEPAAKPKKTARQKAAAKKKRDDKAAAAEAAKEPEPEKPRAFLSTWDR